MKKRWWLAAAAIAVAVAGGLTLRPRGSDSANPSPNLRTARVARGTVSVVLNE
nr:hypothetical protein [Gemmatimonadota bacterium]NIS03170.1 hypothetical protein [Gemmatimonadota bacterium]NIT69067.1 hypothetical protein [Gemmatimonadota bacterium]NIV25552.1 hypothetical protein [Gemmatimonadota bacterium]NIW38136.1 hypothetical protein [Gemmatimonadota bacterium]